MPLYAYNGIESSGRAGSGTVEAEDIAAAAQQLRARGLTITALAPAAAPAAGPALALSNPFARVRNADLSLFLHQLASLLSSGITIVRGLRLLEEQSERAVLRRLLGRIRAHIEGGGTFAEALARHPRHFPRHIPAVVRAGEMSGTLDQALGGIADDMDEAAAFRAQIIAGFIYPSIVLAATLGAFFFLAGYVIPRIVPFLSVGGGRLPWNTRLMIDVSEAVVRHGPAMATGAVIAAVAIALAYATPAGRYAIDLGKIRLPVVGPVWRLSSIVAFAKNAATLLGSGITMVETLGVVRMTVANSAMQRAVEAMRRRVSAGENLSAAMGEARHLFPPMVIGAVRIGEESGQLADALERSAQIHMRMLRGRIRRMIASIEPIITIILGLIVGFVAWGLVAGMLSMY